MTTRHEMQDGAWVEVRDPRMVTYRQRKPLVMPYERLSRAFRRASEPTSMPASPQPGDTSAPDVVRIEVNDQMLDDGEAMTVCLALALVDSWSFGPPPTTADDVLNLPAVALDELDSILLDYLPRIFLDRSVSQDDTSPTQP